MKLTVEFSATELQKMLQAIAGSPGHGGTSEDIMSTIRVEKNGKLTSSNPDANLILKVYGRLLKE